MNAVDVGLSLMRAGFGMFEAGMKFSEMMLASHGVIGKRAGIIDKALRDPFAADYRELGRMVPEKVAAFGRSGAALAEEWRKSQSEMFDQWREWTALMTSVPNAGRIQEFGEGSARRGVRLTEQSMGVGSVVLAPVHLAATSNARRLGRKSGRRRS